MGQDCVLWMLAWMWRCRPTLYFWMSVGVRRAFFDGPGAAMSRVSGEGERSKRSGDWDPSPTTGMMENGDGDGEGGGDDGRLKYTP